MEWLVVGIDSFDYCAQSLHFRCYVVARIFHAFCSKMCLGSHTKDVFILCELENLFGNNEGVPHIFVTSSKVVTKKSIDAYSMLIEYKKVSERGSGFTRYGIYITTIWIPKMQKNGFTGEQIDQLEDNNAKDRIVNMIEEMNCLEI